MHEDGVKTTCIHFYLFCSVPALKCGEPWLVTLYEFNMQMQIKLAIIFWFIN